MDEEKSCKEAEKEKGEQAEEDTPKKAAASKKKYFHCHSDGYWKRNCLLYLKSLKKQKADAPSEDISNLLVIESNLMVSSTSSWVLDSSLSAHICTSMQDLVESRGLRKGEMILHISNGAKVAAVTIGTYPLQLSIGFRLVLKDYYYIFVASRNLIFVSILAQDRFEFNFNKIFYNIYLRNKLIVRALLIDSLYHLHVDASMNINE